MTTDKTKRSCDHPACHNVGLYPAPKNKQDSREFYWFCLAHIREYNAKWNYFGNLSPQDIEKEIRRATVWERPTWPFGKGPVPRKARASSTPQMQPLPAVVQAAYKAIGLAPPQTMKSIKAKYRELAKRFHPDANKGSQKEIEKFLLVQQAFATLQKFYAKTTRQTRK